MEQAYFAIAADTHEEYRPNIPANLPPSLIKLGSLCCGLSIEPGTAIATRPISAASFGSNQRAGLQCRFDHQCQLRQRGNQTVAARKVACKRTRVKGNSRQSILFQRFHKQGFIGRRVNAVYTGSPDGNGATICLQCP